MEENPEENKVNGSNPHEVNDEVKQDIASALLENNTISSASNIKVYKRRWFMLALFMLYSGANAYQWLSFSIIANIIAKYYNVSLSTVDWISITYMVIYPILLIPSSYLIDMKGLRVAGILGALGTALGALIKAFSVRPDLFYVLLFAQVCSAVAQCFSMCLPSKVAAVWFPPSEISKACAISIFGAQVGFALGFLIPPHVVGNHENIENIGHDLKILNWGLVVYMLPVAVAVFFFFKVQPELAPSVTQYEARLQKQTKTIPNFLNSFKDLLLIKAYIIHMFSFGLNMGVFVNLGTFLNQFILHYFEHAEADAGRMGLLMVISGMFGNIFFGVLLDKTHKYRELAFIDCIICTLTLLGFLIILNFKIMWLTYLMLILYGFFSSGYLPLSFEFGIELTFPAEESTILGILNTVSQILSCIIALIIGKLNKEVGPMGSLGFMVGLMVLGTITTRITPNNLRRQAVFKRNEASVH